MATKTLMVLAEQGIVAMSLFLATRKNDADKQAARAIHRALKQPKKHRVELTQKRLKAVLQFLARSKEPETADE